MAESVALTTPITYTSDSTLHIQRLIVDVDAQSVTVTVVGNGQLATTAFYPTPAVNGPLGSLQPTGATLIHTINTSNFSVNSLAKAIYNRLQTDGYIGAGSITGTPS